jgi:diguanylate cyclase (GGDEF)-like protein
VEPENLTSPRAAVWRRKTIARDTAFLVFGLCLVAAVFTGLAARQFIEASLRSGLEAELRREFQRVEASFELWRVRASDDLAAVARDPELTRALAEPGAAPDLVRERLALQIEAKPEVLGLALIRGRGRTPRVEISVAATDWLPERWASSVDGRLFSTEKLEFVRIDGLLTVVVATPVGTGNDRAMLAAALDPRAAFTAPGRSTRARVAISVENGEMLGGVSAALAMAHGEGYAEARDEDGARYLALRQRLSDTPLWVSIALPEASVPSETIASIVVASVLIALAAAGVAFEIGERRLRPLDEVTESARRIASGETGVRVEVDAARGEVAVLARSFNDMAGQLETQRRAVEERNGELMRANEVLEQLSITDGLTHLHNHRHFHDQFSREVKRADRSGQPLCLMLIDIDDFKVLNDNHGHASGDLVLAAAAQLMNAQVRESDYLARYGGEEFAMLLPQTRLDGAVALAEKIRSALSEHAFALADAEERVRVTVSIGVAEHIATADETFDAADRALYEAKAAGKDCVIAAPQRDRDRPQPLQRRRR